MSEAAAEPIEPGYVAAGLRRLLPPRLQGDEWAMRALASFVGAVYRAAGFGARE